MEMQIFSIIFLPMGAAVFSYMIGRFNKNLRSYFADAVTGIVFALTLYLFVQALVRGIPEMLVEIPYICGMGLHFTLDGFRALYCMIAALM